MALIKCPECEHEISDTAKKCPHCGYTMKSVVKAITNNKDKYAKIIAILAIVLAIILIISICTPANIKLQNIKKENSKLEILFNLGIPMSTEDDSWRYENSGIKFHGIPAKYVTYDFEDNQYHFYFDDEEMDNVKNVLSKYCEKAGSLYDFRYYTYEEIDLTLLNTSLFIE